jgi:hypothetical protein
MPLYSDAACGSGYSGPLVCLHDAHARFHASIRGSMEQCLKLSGKASDTTDRHRKQTINNLPQRSWHGDFPLIFSEWHSFLTRK